MQIDMHLHRHPCVALTLEKEIAGGLHSGMTGGRRGGDIMFMIYPLVHLGLDYLDAFLIQNKYFKCKKVCGEDRVWILTDHHRGTKQGYVAGRTYSRVCTDLPFLSQQVFL